MPRLRTADGKLHLRFGRKRVPLRLLSLRPSLRSGRRKVADKQTPTSRRGLFFYDDYFSFQFFLAQFLVIADGKTMSFACQIR